MEKGFYDTGGEAQIIPALALMGIQISSGMRSPGLVSAGATSKEACAAGKMERKD